MINFSIELNILVNFLHFSKFFMLYSFGIRTTIRPYLFG